MTVMTAFKEGLKPTENLLISEWADRYGVLPRKSSKEAGKWRTDRAPYLRKILDCLSPQSPVQQIKVMKGSQLGFTSAGLMWFAYTVDADPGPFMAVMPSLDVAKRHSKTRLAPMIEESPRLQGRVAEPRERGSLNTVLYKEFQGGYLVIAGANSASSLRSLPVKKLILDEIDSYEADLQGEGDTVSISEKRCDTFGSDRKIYKLSTPTIAGISAIEAEFEDSDQQFYYLACPYCSHRQILQWENIKFEHDNYILVSEVAYQCSHCNEHIQEHHKQAMLAGGQWIAHNPGHEHAGFHLSSLYSPLGWLSWRDIVQEFLKAKRKNDFQLMKTWKNTRLGLPWSDEEQRPIIEESSLQGRVEHYGPAVPLAGLVLTASVDVQSSPSRLEVEIKAWGPDDESWTLEYEVLDGDPAQHMVWQELADLLWKKKRYHESGPEIPVSITLIDSGGHFSQQVYDFCRKYRKYKCFASKGSQFPGKPIFERAKRQRGGMRGNVDFFIGTDTAKDTIFALLNVAKKEKKEIQLHRPLTEVPVTVSPYYMHFNQACDEEYFAQLVAERPEKIKSGRRYVRRWVQIRERNEALDLAVLNLAGIRILNPNWERIVETLAKRKSGHVEPVKKAVQPVHDGFSRPVHLLPRRHNRPWVSDWGQRD
jgi:phage terminase large subunit GpA-like protein